jgi:hypothetical protein
VAWQLAWQIKTPKLHFLGCFVSAKTTPPHRGGPWFEDETIATGPEASCERRLDRPL